MSGTRRASRLLIALAVATVVLLGVTTWGAVELRDRRLVAAARVDALAAARSAAVDLLSYDFRRLDADFERGRRHVTGRFAEEYATTTEKTVRPTATRYQAVVEATLVDAGVRSATRDRAIVIVFVNQTSRNTRLVAPQIDQNRVRLTLTRVGEAWLVSEVDAL